jgi:mRNA interferase RelE/StbE
VADFRQDIPPPVAEVIRHLPPALKRSIKHAIRAISVDPNCGEPLQKELEGYWKFKVRRFRIVYRIDRTHRIIRIVAVGHRRTIYEEATEQLRQRS